MLLVALMVEMITDLVVSTPNRRACPCLLIWYVAVLCVHKVHVGAITDPSSLPLYHQFPPPPPPPPILRSCPPVPSHCRQICLQTFLHLSRGLPLLRLPSILSVLVLFVQPSAVSCPLTYSSPVSPETPSHQPPPTMSTLFKTTIRLNQIFSQIWTLSFSVIVFASSRMVCRTN